MKQRLILNRGNWYLMVCGLNQRSVLIRIDFSKAMEFLCAFHFEKWGGTYDEDQYFDISDEMVSEDITEVILEMY